jgi:hypothetical protein
MSHPILWTIATTAVLYFILWLVFLFSSPVKAHTMDPRNEPGSFENHLKRYQELARLVLTLSTATIAFLLNFLVNQFPSRAAESKYAAKLGYVAPPAILFLCGCGLFLLVFISALNFFYEQYSHFQYLPANHKEAEKGQYQRWKYAVVLSASFSGLICFMIAYVILASSLF